jgi:hypothetical protein
MVMKPAEALSLCWRGPVATVNYRSVLSSERVLNNNKPTTYKYNFKEEEKKNYSQVPDGGLTQGQAGRQTVSRKITLT